MALSTGVLCLIIRKVLQEAMNAKAELIWGHTSTWHTVRHPGKVVGTSPQLAFEAVPVGKL